MSQSCRWHQKVLAEDFAFALLFCSSLSCAPTLDLESLPSVRLGRIAKKNFKRCVHVMLQNFCSLASIFVSRLAGWCCHVSVSLASLCACRHCNWMIQKWKLKLLVRCLSHLFTSVACVLDVSVCRLKQILLKSSG